MSNIETVRGLAFFKGLSEAELASTVALCEEKSFKDGELILEEGSRGPGLFILAAGAGQVEKGLRGRFSHVLKKLSAGDHFGEMSLITEGPTAATVRAAGETRCLLLPRAAFIKLLDDDPHVARKVLWAFVERLSRNLAENNESLIRALYIREARERRLHLFGLLKLQLWMFFSYVWASFRENILRWKLSVDDWSRLHRKNARRFKRTAFRLKGANVKMGQLASMQSHILPKEYIEEFKEMRDKVTPTDYPMIASLIQSEFGLGPLELFEEFDKIPIAAASMGQVHPAKLKSGERVVVKVQHPGLERSVEIDLALMRFMARVVSVFFKKLDLMQMMRESEEPLRRELDLLLEGQATELLGRQLEPQGVLVPKIYWRYSTRRVLTMGFIDGVNIDRVEQLKEWKIDRPALMSTYLRAFLKQAFEGGFFHADPHPGNVFCTRDGKLAMLDFGMVKTLPEHVRSGLLKEVLGCFFNNPRLYCDGLIEKGMIGEADREKVEVFAAKAFVDPAVRSIIFDHKVEKEGDVKTLVGSLGDLFKTLETFQTPRDNLMFLRALGIVTDVCKEVVPEIPVSQLAMPVVMPIFAEFMQKNPQYLPLAAAAMAPPPLPAAVAAKAT